MNAVGIDVSKGKSTVAVVQPFGVVVAEPFDVPHTDSDLKALREFMKRLYINLKRYKLCMATLWQQKISKPK